MPQNTGSVACLSKQTISNLLECTLSCIIFVASLYILTLFLHLIHVSEIDILFQTIGYISVFIIATTPIGLYGSVKGNYIALLSYFVIGFYYLYTLIIYIWFNIRTKSIISFKAFDLNAGQSTKASLSEVTLHQITTGAYTLLVIISIILVTLRIISVANQVEPAKVIVVDNNPVD